MAEKLSIPFETVVPPSKSTCLQEM